MPSEHARHWPLDPRVDFLNHGSYGATPRVVQEAQQAWRLQLEQEPVRFMAEQLEPALDAARAAVGGFVGASPDDLAFVTNATTGVNTVLRSLRFEPDDELLTTDHEYNAVRNALEFVAARDKASVVVAEVPFPVTAGAEVTAAVLAAVTPRTRLAVLDHVTSATALVFPVAELVRELTARGVDTLLDGAHAPGMLDLDVAGLGAAYYTGNLHKWVCAPKGAAFLWVRPDHQDRIRPLVISHGANSPRTDRSRFRLQFDWLGTADPSAWLAVPAAIEFGGSLLEGGWSALRARNRALVLEARGMLGAALGVDSAAPEAMIGMMASLPLAWERKPGTDQDVDLYGDAVHGALLAAGFQTMIAPWPQRPQGRRWRRLLRLSAAAYNDRAQFERLASTLPHILAAAA
ncbi:MAG TPA: aminotransferase class V-fold PLP-dependent enzyme [Candidatus Limnocylindria bacterium]|nr:aminotransferase class V-fold PLP-dependent enzyme [Candidatus Limnocylindria bacterium]